MLDKVARNRVSSENLRMRAAAKAAAERESETGKAGTPEVSGIFGNIGKGRENGKPKGIPFKEGSAGRNVSGSDAGDAV